MVGEEPGTPAGRHWWDPEGPAGKRRALLLLSRHRLRRTSAAAATPLDSHRRRRPPPDQPDHTMVDMPLGSRPSGRWPAGSFSRRCLGLLGGAPAPYDG